MRKLRSQLWFDDATHPSLTALYLERYKHSGAGKGSHFLTADQPSIDRLTAAAGFRYVWDAQTGQFAHPTGIIVATDRQGWQQGQQATDYQLGWQR